MVVDRYEENGWQNIESQELKFLYNAMMDDVISDEETDKEVYCPFEHGIVKDRLHVMYDYTVDATKIKLRQSRKGLLRTTLVVLSIVLVGWNKSGSIWNTMEEIIEPWFHDTLAVSNNKDITLKLLYD